MAFTPAVGGAAAILGGSSISMTATAVPTSPLFVLSTPPPPPPPTPPERSPLRVLSPRPRPSPLDGLRWIPPSLLPPSPSLRSFLSPPSLPRPRPSPLEGLRSMFLLCPEDSVSFLALSLSVDVLLSFLEEGASPFEVAAVSTAGVLSSFGLSLSFTSTLSIAEVTSPTSFSLAGSFFSMNLLSSRGFAPPNIDDPVVLPAAFSNGLVRGTSLSEGR
mmetsp:Transcript_7661/g.17015  ORF Transcript_7661/g.17015 Transcript_7661/m.17015 type:complete len:217 (-) Transcript_7661:923-1573(-)